MPLGVKPDIGPGPGALVGIAIPAAAAATPDAEPILLPHGAQLTQHLPGVLRAVLGILLQTAIDERGQRRRHLRGDLRERRVGLGAGVDHDRARGLAVEGRTAGQRLVEHHAERPHVGRGAHALGAHRLLGRHVVRRPHGDAGVGDVVVRAVEIARDAEVEDLDDLAPVALLRHEDVLGLEVAVDDALLVRGRQRLEDALEVVEHEIERDAALGQAIAQRLAVEQLHRHEEQAVLGVEARVVDLDDAVVADLRRRAHLAQEALPRRLVLADVREEDLERDALLAEVVRRLVDLAHPALGDLALDAVATPDQPVRKRQLESPTQSTARRPRVCGPGFSGNRFARAQRRAELRASSRGRPRSRRRRRG